MSDLMKGEKIRETIEIVVNGNGNNCNYLQ